MSGENSGKAENDVNKSQISVTIADNNNRGTDQGSFDAAGPGPSSTTVVFPFTPSQLGSLVDPKDPSGLAKLGGVLGICQGLRVDPTKGHSTNGGSIGILDASRRAFGENVIPHPAPPTFLWFLWEAYKDKTLLFLSGAALISLSIGIYEDVKKGTLHHWIEGAAIMLAVCLVVLVGAVNDWQKDRQFRALSAKAEDRLVRVLRDGLKQQVSIFELVVGDVVLLDPGDVLPADGLLLDSHGIVCDESGATGESDQVKKDPAKDPFFISGTKVLDGSGSMVVIGVGLGSFHGRMLMAMRVGPELTPLQAKLNRLAEAIAKLGFLAAASMFVALMVKYLVQHAMKGAWPPVSELLSQLVTILIQAITVVVVAVPEGLPMAVTLALAFATTRMLQDRNLVRVLSACETMGNATSICSDKTGTLTENRMTVVRARILSSPVIEDVDVEESKSLATLVSSSSSIALDLVGEAIAVNSTAFSAVDPATGRVAFVGSKTEAALLAFLARLQFDYGEARSRASVVRLFPFASERKTMSTVIKTWRPNGVPCYRLHTKGASEMVLRMCTSAMRADGTVADLAGEELAGFEETIEVFAKASLRTIAVAFRDFPEANGDGELDWLGSAASPPAAEGLTLLAILGIADPLRPGVPEAVAACQRAGIFIRMVTGDNLMTARSIAEQCGILMRGGLVMEGPAFRQLDEAALLEVVPRLQVLARSSPLDKQILVRTLRSMGDVVAVTGDGTNDGPAMRAANVSFAMGIAGTEVAKEASSIILLDDNFTSILRAVLWGRCVNDSVRKFLQFQLTVNLAAVVVALVSALADAEDRSVLSAIQLLWVNLIMDSLAALALATDKPSVELLERHPESQQAPLITPSMWRMILGQAAFQITAVLLLTFLAPTHLSSSLNPSSPQLSTFIFNTFVFLQLFNEVNCRRLDAHLNVFAGISRNAIFLGIWWGTVAVQVLIVAFGGAAFNTTPIGWELWLLSIAIAAISLPLGALIRLVPWPKTQASASAAAAEQRVYMSRERLQWQAAADDVRRGLRVFSALRRSYTQGQQQHEQ